MAIDDPKLFEVAAELLRGRKVGGRPLEVRRFRGGGGADPFHILYVGTVDASLAVPGERPVLTVGDRPGFAAAGGHIELLRRDDRLRFGINRDALRRSGLAISSQVLDLAEFVIEAGKEHP